MCHLFILLYAQIDLYVKRNNLLLIEIV